MPAQEQRMHEHEREGALDLRHIGRFYDKEMAIDKPGMEMSKPGMPDLRRRKHSVNVPGAQEGGPADNPPQNQR